MMENPSRLHSVGYRSNSIFSIIRPLHGFRYDLKDRYLILARRCLENAENLTSQSDSKRRLQFNHMQCKFLVNELNVAVKSAEWWVSSSARQSFPKKDLNVLKLLYWTAREIEIFIEGCCNEEWIKGALILGNMKTSAFWLGSNLEFLLVCLNEEDDALGAARNWEQLDVLSTLESSKQRVVCDQRALHARLQAVISIHSRSKDSRTSATEAQLANCLYGRLSQHLSGPVKLSVWEIDYSSLKHGQKLGKGSFGEVHQSIWLPGQIKVAEKMFEVSNDPSFRNEVEVLARLAHPNIVPFLGYATRDGKCSIIMELMEGDLSHLMEERLRANRILKSPFDLPEAVDMMLQTAEGMRYLHDSKIVHRDLKSQNILLRRRHYSDKEYVYLKVADFGLSKTKENSITSSKQTMNTGTARWMAPELIGSMPNPQSNREQEKRYPFKVDIYSFGMLCFEILTGKVPFWATASHTEVKEMVLKGDRPTLPAECPDDLGMLIQSCWDSEPSNRPSFKNICWKLRDLKVSLMKGTGRVCTIAECQNHRDREDCWIVISGKVYDVTSFLHDHPGGAEVILQDDVAGKDATDSFEAVGHSKFARAMMANYLIGTLAST